MTPALKPTPSLTETPIDDAKPVTSYVRKFWKPFSLGTVTLALTNLFDVLTPFALMKAIDAIADRDLSALTRAVGLYLLFMAGAVSFRHQWRVHFGRFHHSVAEDLRNRLFEKYTSLGPRFFEKNPTGELMSLMINDVNTFRMGIGPGLLILMDGILLITFIVPFMISISWEWTWKSLILIPLIPFIIRFMEDRIGRVSRTNQNDLAALSGYTQELVAGIRVVKGFSQEENRQQKHREFSQTYADSSNLLARYDAFFEPALQIGVAAGSVVLLAWGSKDVLSGAVTLGTFVAFHEYIKRMIWPMAALGSGFSMLSQARSSYDRMAEVFNAEPEVRGEGSLVISKFESIEVKNLSYTYPDSQLPALSNLNFTLKAGQRLGIIGPVGSGKSTLVHLLTRVREVPRGTILLNGSDNSTGLDLRDLDVQNWRALLAVTPQEAFLFSQTIENNLLFGRDHQETATPHADALAVADAVHIRNEVERLPLAFRAWLGEKGVNLSGGQRQRMTMARSLAQIAEGHPASPAQLVILDDSLSAVDAKTERELLTYLKARDSQKPVSMIVISHRVPAVRDCDFIMVLNNGEIEFLGPHNAAMQNSETYRNLCALQGETSETAQGAST